MSRVPLRNALHVARRNLAHAEPVILDDIAKDAPELSPYLTVHRPAPMPAAAPVQAAPSSEAQAPIAPSSAPVAPAEAQVDPRILEEIRRQNEPLLAAVERLTEALYAEQEIVKDENRRIVGVRRKRPSQAGAEPDIEISE